MSDLTDLETELAEFKAARSKILSGGQSISTDGRTLTRANLKDIQDHINALQIRISRLRTGRTHATPVFAGRR